VCAPVHAGGTFTGTTVYGSTAICGAVICGGATTLTGALSGTSATFSSSVTANATSTFSNASSLSAIFSNAGAASNYNSIELRGGTAGTAVNWQISKDNSTANAFELAASTTAGGTTYASPVFKITSTGAATFSGNSTTFAANTSNRAFVATGKDNYFAAEVVGGSTTGQSYGQTISAGTNSSDIAFQIYNKAETAVRLFVRGDGNIGVGMSSPRSILEIQKTSNNTSIGVPSNATLTLSQGGAINELSQIGLGYTTSNSSPAAIGYITTSTTDYTKGALIFATRDVNTDTAPTERLRIASTGAATFSGDVLITNSSNAQIGFNTTGALNSTGAYLYYNRSGSNKWTSGMGPVDGSNDFQIATGGVKALNLTVTTGAATFSSTVTTGDVLYVGASGGGGGVWTWDATNAYIYSPSGKTLWLTTDASITKGLKIATSGAATFSSTVCSTIFKASNRLITNFTQIFDGDFSIPANSTRTIAICGGVYTNSDFQLGAYASGGNGAASVKIVAGGYFVASNTNLLGVCVLQRYANSGLCVGTINNSGDSINFVIGNCSGSGGAGVWRMISTMSDNPDNCVRVYVI
jgi:hypothetical protein